MENNSVSQTSRDRATRMTSNWLRMFFIFYVFGFFIITTTYKGALVSYSAIPVIPNPIGRSCINNRFCAQFKIYFQTTFKSWLRVILLSRHFKKSLGWAFTRVCHLHLIYWWKNTLKYQILITLMES